MVLLTTCCIVGLALGLLRLRAAALVPALLLLSVAAAMRGGGVTDAFATILLGAACLEFTYLIGAALRIDLSSRRRPRRIPADKAPCAG